MAENFSTEPADIHYLITPSDTADLPRRPRALRYPGLEILNPCPMPVVSPTGEVDAEGAPVMAPVPGYHVNAVCRGECPEALGRWRVYPATPFAVLAT